MKLPTIVYNQNTTSNALRTTEKRKTFYANGRYWLFFVDGVNFLYSSSTDNVTWLGATTIKAALSGIYFSVCTDGTNVHYVYHDSNSDLTHVYYRMGSLGSDGTVTWLAGEQTVTSNADYQDSEAIEVDSNGYPFIFYTDSSSYPYVDKSSTKDGTWTSDGAKGFPFKLYIAGGYYYGLVVPLTSGKMLVAYGSNLNGISMRSWDGTSTWNAPQTTSGTISFDFAGTSQGDDVHFVFLAGGDSQIRYAKYTYASNTVGGETAIVTGISASDVRPVISINSANNLYCFYMGHPTAYHIYYKTYDGSSWSAAVDWIDSSENQLTFNDRISCFLKGNNYIIGVSFFTQTDSQNSPWLLWYATLDTYTYSRLANSFVMYR